MTHQPARRAQLFEWGAVLVLGAALVFLVMRRPDFSSVSDATPPDVRPASAPEDGGDVRDTHADSLAQDAPTRTATGAQVEVVDLFGLGERAASDGGVPAPRERPVLEALSLSEGLPTAGQWRGGSLLIDLDADGRPDLVTSIRRLDGATPGEGLTIFRNEGEGRWSLAVDGLRRDLGYGGSAVADLDRDGHADVAFSGHDASPHVFLGDGAGRWRIGGTGLEATGMCADVALGDLDRDGFVDLAVLGFQRDGPGLRLFAGVGGGTFVPLAELLPREVFGARVAMPDLDGDGHPELVATTSLGPKVFRFDGARVVESSEGLPSPEIGGSDLGIDARDLDGDGFAELLVTGMIYPGHDALRIFRFDGERWARWGSGLPDDESFFDGVFAHLDDDGADWLVLGGKAGIQLVRVSPDGRCASAGRLADTEGVFNVAAGDVDGDGLDEVVFVGIGGVRVLAPRLPESGGS